MKKLLVITPHTSTGGAPQVTANKVELLKNDFEIKVVEYSCLAWNYIVQKNRIIESIGKDNFITLWDNKHELLDIIKDFKPDVIAMEEFPEMFMNEEIATQIYSRKLFGGEHYIIETTHDSSFKVENKLWVPDEFVFVSPYTALKYKDFKVPTSVIEYPIDKLQRDKRASREKLGLEHDYKHISIIGLFTPRKNQKYAFELAERLKEYKVKFHFLGNQAENFQNYWKPLMSNKPENCIVWGERADTDEFLRASDLFLFPSKGDRNNKELNPIVIKESMQYDDLPKLLYNLDVYLNRYNNEHNFNYLVSDLDEDAKKIIEIVQPKTKVNNEEIIILGTFPNLKSRVQLTKDTINSLKPLGRKIMLVSHYPVDDEIQRMVDYYIFDSENPLTHHSYYTKFYNYRNDYDVEININGLKNSNQALTVVTNLFNATKLAKGLGYKSFFYNTYDVITDEKDYASIEKSFESIKEGKKGYLATLDTPFQKGIQTNGMTFDIDYFLENFEDIRNVDEFNRSCVKIGSQNFLEDYLMKKVNLLNQDELTIITNKEQTFLTNSGLGVASNSEYYSILPIEGKPNKYMFYFFTYNIDNRKIHARIDNLMFVIDIAKDREYKHEFEYVGKPIKIKLEFYDGDNIYKTDNYTMDEKNIGTYKNTGFYKLKNIKPKIKLVHIQTTRNDEREQKSRESLEKVKNYGWEYVLHINEPYASLPPSYNSLRPKCVSIDLFDDAKVQELGTALTPSHYGCYEAFKNAILCEFDEEVDFLMVCEGDCIIEKPIDEFIKIVENSCPIIEKHNIGYMSYGDYKTLEHGWLQSPVIEAIPNQDILYVTNHIIGLQSIMFPKKTRKWLKETLRTHKWDAADMYFNSIFRYSEYRMAIVHNRLTTQAMGYSLIDKQEKKFL